MMLAIGVLIGIAVSTLIVTTLTYFRAPIERIARQAEVKVASVGPKPKGFIVESESEAEEARNKIIAKNNRLGRPTKLTELNDDL